MLLKVELLSSLKDEAGDQLYFSYCQQIPKKTKTNDINDNFPIMSLTCPFFIYSLPTNKVIFYIFMVLKVILVSTHCNYYYYCALPFRYLLKICDSKLLNLKTVYLLGTVLI